MTKVTAILGMFVLFLYFPARVLSDVNIPGLGSGAYDVPSVGGPGDKVDKAANCETHLRPKITKVTPDPVKPGEKITIKGENFQSKECLQDVSFGSRGGTRSEKNNFKYVDEGTVEAIVPELKPGLSPVNIVTVGGSAQQILLIQAKDGASANDSGSAKDGSPAMGSNSTKDGGAANDGTSVKDGSPAKDQGASKDEGSYR